MNEPEAFELKSASGRILYGRVHFPSRIGPRPTVVICHGFKGFMEWGFFPHVAELLAARGFTAVRFNFSGSGMRPGDEQVTDPDAFGTATFSQDLEDLMVVLTALGDRIAPGRVDLERVGLFGHSRGGGTTLLATAHESWWQRLGCLVTWSAVSTFDRLSEPEKSHWRQNGSVPVVNTRTGQKLDVGVCVLEDLESHAAELDLLAAAKRCQIPWLIVHGSDDETVPADEAARLAHHASTADLNIIDHANHTFGATHPFSGPNPQLMAALNRTQAWFLRNLA